MPSSIMGRASRRAFPIFWIAGLLPALSLQGAAGDPPHYSKRGTWQETLLASLEALDGTGLEDGFEPFESGILRGGDPAERVRVDISGGEEMFLFVTGCPDVIWGVADWAEARLISRDGAETSLGTLKSLKEISGRLSIDVTLRSGLDQKLSIAGRTFERGLNVQADTAVSVSLGKKYERFEAWIGVDGWAGRNGHVRFSVTGPRTAARKTLWSLLERDFPEDAPRREMRWEREDRIHESERKPGDLAALAARYAGSCGRVPPLEREARWIAASVEDRAVISRVREIYYRSRAMAEAIEEGRSFPFRSLRLAIEDLRESFGEKYARGRAYLERLDSLEKAVPAALPTLQGGSLEDFQRAVGLADELKALQREALIANPLLDFDRLLVVRRKPRGDPRRSMWADRGLGEFIGLPRQSSWGLSTIPDPDDWENEIAVLSPVGPDGELAVLFKPEGRKLVTDVDLHFDADRMLFSMPDDRRRWQVWEIDAGGKGLRQVTPGDQPEVHSYDSCYLPSGDILFDSTAVLQGVPCNAGVVVGQLYRTDPAGKRIRQICFEQDHDYCPSILNDGRVLYLRWDYTDTPHVWNRVLMSMNPDGTSQMEYYGSNSYWPNAVFFARPIPGHPTKIAGIVTGHHEGRVGELVIFDPALGRHEVQGVVQRIPGRGKEVEPLIEDKLTEHSWPKFVHPNPLSEKYFIVSAKPRPESLWGVYLVDVFDNMTLLREEEGRAILEPIPFRKVPRPPVIPDRVRPHQKDALVELIDVYEGPGLRGIPRGEVKRLRIFTYHFGYQTLAGIDHRIGSDGPWEVKKVLGTVPVEEDGSASFRIPAKTPISVQPLDAEGKAMALMRSWMTAMPGEILSCVGCHEKNDRVPSNRKTIASARTPSEIAPFHGSVRGFSFPRDVQPVLDRHCVGCHDGGRTRDGRAIPDLRADQGCFVAYETGNPDGKFIRGVPRAELIKKYGGVFDPSYVALRRFVRTGGLESDLHVLPPGEFHADSSELVQMLEKGHGDVRLDGEAWEWIITWIDLNAPCNGTWSEVRRIPGNQRERRLTLRRLYGGLDEDDEAIQEVPSPPAEPIVPQILASAKSPAIDLAGWPFDSEEANRRQEAAGPSERTVDLGGGVTMEFVWIPAGSFVMGSPEGAPDERPASVVTIPRPFWMAKREVTNRQFARFNPSHDSRFEHRTSWIFSEEYLGWRLDGNEQPVVRVTWNESMAFCHWLSEKIGEKACLPTEAQWEYACRAGTATPFSFGSLDSDFSPFANLADRNIRRLADEGWRPKAPDLVPRDDRFDDGALVTAKAGSYRPNAWGLFDLHGNAAEWTRTTYRPYPHREDDGREAAPGEGRKVVRGGSWRDRPGRCTSSYRLCYPPHLSIFNVGFRVAIEED